MEARNERRNAGDSKLRHNILAGLRDRSFFNKYDLLPLAMLFSIKNYIFHCNRTTEPQN